MCKSKAHGGQRCGGHALVALQRAAATYEASPTLTNYEAVLDGQANFASTPSGAHVLREAVLTAEDEGQQQEADNLARVLEKGAEIRERNKAIEAAMKAPWSAKHDEEDHQSLVAAMKTSNIATATEVARGLFATKSVQPAASAEAPRVWKPRYEPDMTNMAPGRKMYHTKDQRETIERNLRRLKREKGSPEDIAMYEAALVENDRKIASLVADHPELLDGPTHRTAPSESALGSWGEYVPASFQH